VRTDAISLAEIFSALGNEKRVIIFSMLAQSQDLKSIQEKAGIRSRAALQKHLNVLMDAFLVVKEGRTRYKITKEGQILKAQVLEPLIKILPEWKKHRDESQAEEAARKIEALTSVAPVDVLERAWAKWKKEKTAE
jgi:DNA-binding transcriptional ArsR family regulator